MLRVCVFVCIVRVFVFFKQKTAYEMRISDWSSDLNMHNELNGSGPDWKIEGNYNILIGCAGVATAASLATAANIINGDYNQIIGGVYDDLEIGSGASNNISTGAKMSGGTVSDNGTDSTFLDCPGVVDKAPAP